jgi:protein-S-isoprenylcysteine O-methyltransferase Ste14
MPDSESAFRWTVAALPVVAIAVSGWFRHRAHQRLDAVPRGAEPPSLIALRLAVALPLMAGFLTYLVAPGWIAWAQLPLPPAVRWLGALAAGLAVALIPWVMVSIGDNISETVLTREGQRLVTHGPYRWVRHPLYSVGLLMVLGLCLLAANLLLAGLWVVLALFFRVRVIPEEERRLAARFGDEHRAWARRTGLLLPRVLR